MLVSTQIGGPATIDTKITPVRLLMEKYRSSLSEVSGQMKCNVDVLVSFPPYQRPLFPSDALWPGCRHPQHRCAHDLWPARKYYSHDALLAMITARMIAVNHRRFCALSICCGHERWHPRLSAWLWYLQCVNMNGDDTTVSENFAIRLIECTGDGAAPPFAKFDLWSYFTDVLLHTTSVDPPHKGTEKRKSFTYHDVIMGAWYFWPCLISLMTSYSTLWRHDL